MNSLEELKEEDFQELWSVVTGIDHYTKKDRILLRDGTFLYKMSIDDVACSFRISLCSNQIVCFLTTDEGDRLISYASEYYDPETQEKESLIMIDGSLHYEITRKDCKIYGEFNLEYMFQDPLSFKLKDFIIKFRTIYHFRMNFRDRLQETIVYNLEEEEKFQVLNKEISADQVRFSVMVGSINEVIFQNSKNEEGFICYCHPILYVKDYEFEEANTKKIFHSVHEDKVFYQELAMSGMITRVEEVKGYFPEMESHYSWFQNTFLYQKN